MPFWEQWALVETVVYTNHTCMKMNYITATWHQLSQLGQQLKLKSTAHGVTVNSLLQALLQTQMITHLMTPRQLSLIPWASNHSLCFWSTYMQDLIQQLPMIHKLLWLVKPMEQQDQNKHVQLTHRMKIVPMLIKFFNTLPLLLVSKSMQTLKLSWTIGGQIPPCLLLILAQVQHFTLEVMYQTSVQVKDLALWAAGSRK